MKRDLDKKKKVLNVYNNTMLKDKTSETTVRSYAVFVLPFKVPSSMDLF